MLPLPLLQAPRAMRTCPTLAQKFHQDNDLSNDTAFVVLSLPLAGTPHHEYMHPTPQGFYFRKKLHNK